MTVSAPVSVSVTNSGSSNIISQANTLASILQSAMGRQDQDAIVQVVIMIARLLNEATANGGTSAATLSALRVQLASALAFSANLTTDLSADDVSQLVVALNVRILVIIVAS